MGALVGPTAGLDGLEKRYIYLLSLQGIEQRFLGRPDGSITAPVLHYATYIKSRAKMDPFGVNRQRCAGTCVNWTK